MKQPPEVLALLTDAEQRAREITEACASIRRDWPHMLPDAPPAIRYTFGRSPAAGIVSSPNPADDHVDTALDIDPTTRILSLRRHVTDVLNGWCRVVMEDRDITNAATLPAGTDVEAMCRFLERHGDWLGAQDYAQDCADEVRSFARKTSAVADPPRKERHRLGACPFVVEGDLPDVCDRLCRGVVSMPIASDAEEASCDSCGQVGPVEWWEEAMGRTRWEVATIPELARILHARLSFDVTDRTLRRWVKSGRIHKIEAFGPQPEHRRFDVRLVLEEVAHMDHQCVVCGNPWTGLSDVCTRCFIAQREAKPGRGRDLPAYIVGTATPRLQPTARQRRPEERHRCAYSDLPTTWCGCGRHARQDS